MGEELDDVVIARPPGMRQTLSGGRWLLSRTAASCRAPAAGRHLNPSEQRLENLAPRRKRGHSASDPGSRLGPQAVHVEKELLDPTVPRVLAQRALTRPAAHRRARFLA